MSALARANRLRVDADLRIQVGSAVADLTGSGHRLQVDTDQPVAFWSGMVDTALPAGVGRIDGPRALGRLADALAAHDLELRVGGPNGEIVSLGGEGSSWPGRLLTGSRAVHLGGLRALAPLVVAQFRRSTSMVVKPALLVGAGAAAFGTAAVVLRRRRSIPVP